MAMKITRIRCSANSALSDCSFTSRVWAKLSGL